MDTTADPAIEAMILAEMAAIRRLAETHGLVLDPRAIAAEARDRVALALLPRSPAR